MTSLIPSELKALLALSSRIGRNPLLTQGSSGNTSMKIGRQLWIKASGKWLANASMEDIFIPLDIQGAKDHLDRHGELPVRSSLAGEATLKPSIETAMHLELPHRVVLHVHSIQTIVKAVRSDAETHLKRLLDGLRWEWVPYVSSGLPLAQAIRKLTAKRTAVEILVLGNHGLVVCADDCEAANELLNQVENRLQSQPRSAPDFDESWLQRLAQHSDWQLPDQHQLHGLATDPVSRLVLSRGTLYPCQAIFLGGARQWQSLHPPDQLRDRRLSSGSGEELCFRIIEGRGVLLNRNITNAEFQTLNGLAEVVQRIDASVPVRYLTPSEVESVSAFQQYRSVSNNFGLTIARIGVQRVSPRPLGWCSTHKVKVEKNT